MASSLFPKDPPIGIKSQNTSKKCYKKVKEAGKPTGIRL